MMTAVPISRYLTELPVTRLPVDHAPAQRGTRLARIMDARPEIDPAVEIDKAYRRGLEDGASAARAEYAKQLDDLRHVAAEERVADRLAWAGEEGARLADRMDAAVVEVEGRIAEVVARILEPFLMEQQRRRALNEFVQAITDLTQRQRGLALTITGPEDLLVGISERLNGRVPLVLQVTDDPDVRVETDDTVIESRIQDWMNRVAEAMRV
jgi:hypothetical protein